MPGIFFFTTSKVVADGYSTKTRYRKDETTDDDGHRDMTVDESELEVRERKDEYSRAPNKVRGYDVWYHNVYVPNSYVPAPRKRAKKKALELAKRAIAGYYYTKDSTIYEVFINLRNPYIKDAEGVSWRYAIPNLKELKEAGYEGAILQNISDNAIAVRYEIATDVIVFSPNQIKSATGNNGDFSKSNNDTRYSLRKGANVRLTPSELALRGVVSELARRSGIEVFEDEAEGQRVLDMVNGVRLSRGQKRALETATWQQQDVEANQATAVSSADGAKVLTNIEKLAARYEERESNRSKTFIGDVADAIKASRQGSNSRYATYETPNGKVVTIRLADHNATASKMDYAGREDAISIVITNKENKGITNDGKAHIVEFYYNKGAITRAEGKPLAEIIRSIKQALTNGTFNDTTGLAEREEVNAERIRLQIVFHGSGADFDHFDHSHMGEGEGAQVYGWGTYVTEVEGIGRTYADADASANRFSDGFYAVLRHIRKAIAEGVSFDEAKRKELERVRKVKALVESKGTKGAYKAFLADCEKLESLEEKDIQRHLYTVEIPDDNGSNYLDWTKRPSKEQLQRIKDAYKELIRDDVDDIRESTKAPASMSDEQILDSEASVRIPDSRGEDIYHTLQRELGSPETASKFLSQASFTGIKYPADYLNGGNTEGKKNYVIFNEKDVKIVDHIRFFKTRNGEAYGFTAGGKIYIDPRIATAETPVHEYAHLWAEALRHGNEEEWKNVVGLMKGTSVWDEVVKGYHELKTDDEIADEVLAQYSGRKGAEKLREEQRRIAEGDMSLSDKAAAISAIEKVKEALSRFWQGVCDFLHIHYTSADEVADRVLKDLLEGVNPNEFVSESDKFVRDEDKIAKFENGDPALRESNENKANDPDIKFSLRKEPAPKKTQKAYAAFCVMKDKKSGRITLQPKMVENTGIGAPPLTFLNADTGELLRDNEGNLVKTKTTNRVKVQSSSIGKDGKPSKSGGLAWRPGKHLAAYPNATQFAVKSESGERDKMQDNIVFFEVEYSADKDYQLDAWSYGYSDKGSYKHDQAGLPYIPYNGYYIYRTNANPDIPAMIICGAYKVIRALTDAEAESLNKDAGGVWIPRLSGKVVDGARLKELVLDSEGLQQMAASFPYDRMADARDESADVMQLDGYVARDINFDDPNLQKAAQENWGADWERKLDEYRAEYDERKADMESRGLDAQEYALEQFRQRKENASAAESKKVSLRNDDKITIGETFSKDKKSFDKIRERAIREKGIVLPNLNTISADIVEVSKHNFQSREKNGLRNEARNWGYENLMTHEGEDLPTMRDGTPYAISKDAIKKMTDDSAFAKSGDIDAHLSVFTRLKDVIRNSIETEIHPDYPKDKNGERKLTTKEGEIGKSILVHRLYGAVNIDGRLYRVKTTIHEYRGKSVNRPHSFEVTEIELIDSPSTAVLNPGSKHLDASINSISVANLLQGVEKSYDSGKKLLDESETLAQGKRKFSLRRGKTSNGTGVVESDESGTATTADASPAEISVAVEDLSGKLNLGNVEVVTSGELSGKRARAKGFFDPRTGRITVVADNHTSVADAVRTLLHEAVAHYGLRQMFGEKFDTFLDNVLANASEEVRQKVFDLAKRNGWDFRKATEEYLAGLAESEDFEAARKSGLWAKVKELFRGLLESLGVEGFSGRELTDGDLRYILWRSYENLRGGGVLSMAADSVKREELGVGRPAEVPGLSAAERNGSVEAAESGTSAESEEDLYYRSADVDMTDETARSAYDARMRQFSTRFREAWQDSMVSVLALEEAVLAQRGGAYDEQRGRLLF